MSGDNFRDLSYSTLQEVLAVCEQLHRVDSETSFTQHTYNILKNTVGHIHFSAHHFIVEGMQELEAIAPTLSDEWNEILLEHTLDHPCAQRIMAGRPSDAMAVHQVPNYEIYLKSTLYNEFYKQAQSQGQTWIFEQYQGELLLLSHARDSHYTDTEVAILQLIRPHLGQAWQSWMRERKLKQKLANLQNTFYRTEEEERSAAAIRRQIGNLPNRQREVVELVAMGNDNQQIADELKISVLTVKKHLQLIFKTMEVQHRTALAAKWHKGHSLRVY